YEVLWNDEELQQAIADGDAEDAADWGFVIGWLLAEETSLSRARTGGRKGGQAGTKKVEKRMSELRELLALHKSSDTRPALRMLARRLRVPVSEKTISRDLKKLRSQK